MKRFIIPLISFVILLIPFIVSAQCSDTPVEEAVRNGDFEAGYLTKSGAGHAFTTGGPFDFQSDLTSGFDFTGNNCDFAIANTYGVGRAEPGMTCTASNRQAYLGADYINVANGFEDHTPGQGGDGFAFIADFESFGTTGSYGAPGLPAAWRQEVDIYPNQRYTFSAWFANYNFNAGTAFYTDPVLNFVVIPLDGSNNLVMAERDVLGTATPTGQMVWQQFSGTWIPANNYNRVALFIEVQQANLTNANDIVIDDISFINGCSNLASLPGSLIPDLGAGFSICQTNGTVNLNSNVATGGTTQFWWYSGAGSPQTTEIAGSSSDNTYTINAAGTYRVCVQSASFPAGCSASSTVVVTNTMPPVTLDDAVVCSDPDVTLQASLTGSGLTYDWYKRPGGVPNPDSPNLTTSTAGTYGVQVTSPVPGCGTVTSNDATVTVNLANPTINSFDCSTIPGVFNVSASGGGGSDYAWWDAATGGSQIGTGSPSNINVTSVPTTVYVENFTSASAGTPRGSATGNNAGGASYAETNFTANADFTLVSVWVGDLFGCTGSFTMSLSENGSPTAHSVNVPCAGGWQQVTLNWPITAGNNYRINFPSGPWFSVNSGYSSTSYASGAVTINTASSGGSGAAVDWNIKLGSPCIRTPLELDCPLAVDFLNIDASKTSYGALVTWQTLEDNEPSPYVVERSFSPSQGFVPIVSVPKDNGSYEYEDSAIPFTGIVYYRIAKKQVEGNTVYSPVVSTDVGNIDYAIVPNPFQQHTSFRLTGDSEVVYNITITDLLGQHLSTYELQENSTLEIGETLAPGTYLLHISGNDGYRVIEKIIKAD